MYTLSPRFPASFVAIAAALSFFGCDMFQQTSTPPLTLSSEQPEPGWTYADADEIAAACPTRWTLEVTNHPRRAWRCSHPESVGTLGGCGLTLYETRRARTLEELTAAMRPEIEAYGETSELLDSGSSTLGDQPAQALTYRQVIEGTEVRAWYRIALVDGRAWLAHCVLPKDHVDADADTVEAIFERIQM